MDSFNYTSRAGIFFSCNEDKKFVLEQMVSQHILAHVYSGRILITTANETYSLSAGQTALFGRNQLAKFTKEPLQDETCKSVSVFFSQPFLQQFYASQTQLQPKTSPPKIIQLKTDPLLANLFQSVSIYSTSEDIFITNELARLKVMEALTLIRKTDPTVDSILSDFSEPHKIDLAGFMQTHFMFNISIPEFAYLTGRSLATFKRDFKKVFNTSPQKWLTEKRLEQAHFLIAEKQQKPSQAYIESGFKNFSHFSHAFKQLFGYTPSEVLNQKTHNI